MSMYSVLANDGQAYGPVDEAGLIHWVNEGRIEATTSIRNETTGQVTAASTLPILAPLLRGQQSQPIPAAITSPSTMPTQNQALTQDQFQTQASAQTLSRHDLPEFSVALVVLLHVVTLGIFTWIWFGLMHGKMPKVRHDDPSALRAILFMLIPFFNIYWMFFSYIRLCERIDEQRNWLGLPEESLKSLAIITLVLNLVLSFIPYFGLFAFVPLIVFFAMLQSRVNELVATTRVN